MSFILDYCFLGKFTQYMYTCQNPSKIFTAGFLMDKPEFCRRNAKPALLSLTFPMERATESVEWHLILLPLLVSSVCVFRSLRWKNIRIFTDIKIQSLIPSSVLFLLVQNLAVISELPRRSISNETQESEGHRSGAPNISQGALWLFLSHIQLFLSSYI